MAEALVIAAEREQTPLRVRFRRAFNRGRAAILPRRWVIRWEIRENSRYYAKVIAEARAGKASRDDIQGLEAEAAHFDWELEEEREMLESSRLLSQAGKYLLPRPEFHADPDNDPNWRQGTSFKPTWYLKPQAMQDLRMQIRAERRARREPVAEWIKIIGGLGGVAFLVEKLIGLILR